MALWTRCGSFQSTLPVKGATSLDGDFVMHATVSIHAPSEGSDYIVSESPLLPEMFQSTLPVKGATQTDTLRRQADRFQSTLPVKGATLQRPVA